MPTRTFTVAELGTLGVPPDSPEDVDYSDNLLADEHVTTLKYSQKRRVIFRDGDQTWAVEYEAEVDSGDYEHGPGPDNHGWYGDTITATAVEQRPVVTQQWLPVDTLRDPGLDTVLPAWEAVYEPGNVSDYLIGYANDEAPAKAAAEAWMRSQAEVTGRLEWTVMQLTVSDEYDRWFDLVQRHDDGVDTGPGITVRRRTPA